MTHPTRREFTRATAAAGLLTALSAGRALGANERVRLGFIGLGNRGDQVLDGFLQHKDAEVVALCDLYQPYIDFAMSKIGKGAKTYHDYRELLANKDVDAVVICTPDHWHALQTVHACEAGKDVYVEKPLSLCVAEGRAMVEAARRHKRVTQVGLQRRSSDFCREAAELVRKGGIGKVTVARAFHILNEAPHGIGNPPNEEPPKDFDWENWLGPAPKVPYNRNRAFYRFRWFYDYSGGQLTNFGVHYLDVIHWALGHDAPLAVTAMGGKYGGFDNREVPDTLEVLWQYPGNTLVTFSQYNASAAPAGLRNGEI
jgi:predicted dehydrogenase